LEGNEVPTALTKESVSEPVPKLVRGKGPDPGAFADSPHHPHEGLSARGNLRVADAADALVLRYPLLYLNGE
jgi:hypothetical protein